MLCTKYLSAGRIASAVAGRAAQGTELCVYPLRPGLAEVYTEGLVWLVVSADPPKSILYVAFLVLLDAAELDAITFIDPEL